MRPIRLPLLLSLAAAAAIPLGARALHDPGSSREAPPPERAPQAPVDIAVDFGSGDPFAAGAGEVFVVKIAASSLWAGSPVQVSCHLTEGLQLLSGSLFFEDDGSGQTLKLRKTDEDLQAMLIQASAVRWDGEPAAAQELLGYPPEAVIEGSWVVDGVVHLQGIQK